jgi:predicted transposase/invertase (TIGR01784 family)
MGNINPKIDLVFKKLFGSEENTDILLSLVNAVLPDYQQITTIKIKNPYNLSDYAEGKLSILDIKAEDGQGNLYDIEMQIKGTSFYGKRTLYYWAKIFGSQLDYLTAEEISKKEKKGKSYTDLNKCIVISLMDFDFFSDEQYHRCFMLKDRQTNATHPDLDYLDLYFVELEKFENKYKTLKTTLDRWAKFLNNAALYSKNNLPQELAEIEPIKKASERLGIMYLDEKEREYYEAQQKRYLDETARMQEAVQEAVQAAIKEAEAAAQKAAQKAVKKAVKEAEAAAQKALKKAVKEAEAEAKKVVQEAVQEAVTTTEHNSKLEIAKNAIKKGADNNFIAEITGLTTAQIEELRNQKE